VCASFVVQEETAQQIGDALKIISGWCPGWNPATFMVDFSAAEGKAIQHVFPGRCAFLVKNHYSQ